MVTCSALLTLGPGNLPFTGEFPSQRPVTRSFDVFFDLCLNKRLSKQSWGWWFEFPSCSSWRHSSVASPTHRHNKGTRWPTFYRLKFQAQFRGREILYTLLGTDSKSLSAFLHPHYFWIFSCISEVCCNTPVMSIHQFYWCCLVLVKAQPFMIWLSSHKPAHIYGNPVTNRAWKGEQPWSSWMEVPRSTGSQSMW